MLRGTIQLTTTKPDTPCRLYQSDTLMKARSPIDFLEQDFRSLVNHALAVTADDKLSLRAKNGRYVLLSHPSFDAFVKKLLSTKAAETALLTVRDWCQNNDEHWGSAKHDVMKYFHWIIARQVEAGACESVTYQYIEHWQEIIAHSLRRSLNWTFVAPLSNFVLGEFASTEIELCPWLHIRCRTDVDASKEGRRFAIVVTTAERKQNRLAPAAAEKPVSMALLALRLLKSPRVWVTEITARCDDLFDPGGLSWKPFHATGSRGIPFLSSNDSLYVLNRSDVSTLELVWERLWETESRIWKSEIVFDNYLRAFELQQSGVDQMLLKTWAALEGLFVPEGKRIKALAAQRISAFLSSDNQERDKLSKRVRESYRTRSEIVHGSIPMADPFVVAIETFELLHASLRKFVLDMPKITIAEIDLL